MHGSCSLLVQYGSRALAYHEVTIKGNELRSTWDINPFLRLLNQPNYYVRTQNTVSTAIVSVYFVRGIYDHETLRLGIPFPP